MNIQRKLAPHLCSLGGLASRIEITFGWKINDDARAKSGRKNERVDSSPSSVRTVPPLNVSINPEGVYANEPFNHPLLRGQKTCSWPVPQSDRVTYLPRRGGWHKKGGIFSISGLKGGHNYFLVLWPINLFLAQLSLFPENGHFRDETNDPPNHVKRRRS